jgi:hypothetical protein
MHHGTGRTDDRGCPHRIAFRIAYSSHVRYTSDTRPTSAGGGAGPRRALGICCGFALVLCVSVMSSHYILSLSPNRCARLLSCLCRRTATAHQPHRTAVRTATIGRRGDGDSILTRQRIAVPRAALPNTYYFSCYKHIRYACSYLSCVHHPLRDLCVGSLAIAHAPCQPVTHMACHMIPNVEDRTGSVAHMPVIF